MEAWLWAEALRQLAGLGLEFERMRRAAGLRLEPWVSVAAAAARAFQPRLPLAEGGWRRALAQRCLQAHLAARD